MVHTKSNPVGIDKVIDRIQKLLYDPLKESWGDLDVYGRVYKIQKQDEIKLQRYIGNGEYKPVLYKEGNKIFFVKGEVVTMNIGEASNDLWVVVIVKLSGTNERNDEEYGQEVITLLSNSYLKNIEEVQYGMDNLRRVVEDGFPTGNFKTSDIHTYHVFMVKMNVNYSLIKNNC